MKLIRKMSVQIERVYVEEIDDDMVEFVNEHVNKYLNPGFEITENMIKACYCDWTTHCDFTKQLFPEMGDDIFQAIVDGVNIYFDYMDNYTDYSVSDEDEIGGIATEGNGVFAVIDEVPVSDEDLKKYGFKE